MLKTSIKKYIIPISLIILAIVFFAGASSYNYYSQTGGFVKWGSPDENANYIFSKLYGQTDQISFYEDYNILANEVMHPRSFRSDSGNLKPVSFLGIIIIYGFFAKFFSYEILPYLTPVFGAVGIIFFYLLVKEIFGRRHALVSAILLTSFPVYIYYSARSMFHNVLFISLLIAGLYFFILMAKKRASSIGWKNFFSLTKFSLTWKDWLYSSLAGFLIGLAITARTSELLWLGPVLVILWLFNLRKIGIIKLALFFSFMFLAILPMIGWNQILYGSFTSGGYPEMNQTISNVAMSGKELVSPRSGAAIVKTLENIKENIFVFGFHPDKSFTVFKNYFIKMFPWLFWPAVLGFFLLLQDFYHWRRKHFLFFIAYFLSSAILVLYYGSWNFYDNPDPSRFTIGNSYTRYWLPIYLGAMPLFSIFLFKFIGFFLPDDKKNTYGIEIKYLGFLRNKILSCCVAAIVIFFIIISSINFVIFGSEEGLYYSLLKNSDAKRQYESVLNLTDNNSVIITEYHDKLFFPERKVIVGLFNDPKMNMIYSKLAELMPVYYYNFKLSEADIEYLNSRRLSEFDLRIEEISRISQDFSLYKIHKNIFVFEADETLDNISK